MLPSLILAPQVDHKTPQYMPQPSTWSNFPTGRGARGAADPPAQRSRSRGGKQVGVEPARGSRERRAREGCGRRPPRCGRCPPAGAPGPRPEHPGAVPARAHRSRAAWPSPGVPGGTPPAAPNHPGPPPTSRAAGAQEEEEKAAAVNQP